jgi:hypothetical protein
MVATVLVGLSGQPNVGSLGASPVADQREVPTQPNSGDKPTCGHRSLFGRYGFTVTGTQFFPPPQPPVQAATVGVIEFDGRGGLTGSDIASFSGQIFSRTLAGTYVMQPNCTFEATVDILTGTPGLTFHFSAVMVDGGSEITFIQTDPGSLFVGALKK